MMMMMMIDDVEIDNDNKYYNSNYGDYCSFLLS
jgi:hypothetical protein